MTFRFDDVSKNTDRKVLDGITEYLLSQGHIVIWGISILSHKSEAKTGRVFPESIKPLSDYREFYKVDQADIITTDLDVTYASHGLVHIDHRLLDYPTQEMSILISCSLTQSNIFIPPFNKWNEATEGICNYHDIKLIKYEEGWKSCEHNPFDSGHNRWYLHPQSWTLTSFKKWLK